MCCHYLADSLSGRSARINRAANSRNIATHDCRHETSVDLFPADEANIRSFHHRVSGFDHRYEATTFNHSECFRHATDISDKKAQKAQKNSGETILCFLCLFVVSFAKSEWARGFGRHVG